MTRPSSDMNEVPQLDRVSAYDGFFKIGRYTVIHRRFDGDLSPRLTREVFERGTSVAVLPYDPVTDRVLLIRQFLIGSAVAGMGNFPLQTIAGTIEEDERPADVARREAMEEAGCEIGDLEYAFAAMPSPGGSSEVIHTYIARMDLSDMIGPQGVFGLAEEDENIRVEVHHLADVIDGIESRSLTVGPLVSAVFWLDRHKARLKASWS